MRKWKSRLNFYIIIFYKLRRLIKHNGYHLLSKETTVSYQVTNHLHSSFFKDNICICVDLNVIQIGPLVVSQFNIWSASYEEEKLRNESNRCVINETGDVFPWKQWENAHLEGSWIQIPSMCDGNNVNHLSEN